jgi:hypothetical protein
MKTKRKQNNSTLTQTSKEEEEAKIMPERR